MSNQTLDLAKTSAIHPPRERPIFKIISETKPPNSINCMSVYGTDQPKVHQSSKYNMLICVNVLHYPVQQYSGSRAGWRSEQTVPKY